MIVATRQFGPAIRVHTHGRFNYMVYALHILGITLSVIAGNWLLMGLFNVPAAMFSVALAEWVSRGKRARQETAEIAEEKRQAAILEAGRQAQIARDEAIKARKAAEKARVLYEAALQAKKKRDRNAPSSHKWIASRYA
jgi:hypothetical protein